MVGSDGLTRSPALLALVGASTCGTIPLPPGSIPRGAPSARLPRGEAGTLTGGDVGELSFRPREKNENKGLRLDLGDFSSGTDPPNDVGASTHLAGAILSSPRNDLPESFVLGRGIPSVSSMGSIGLNESGFSGPPVSSGSADRVMGE